MKCPKCGYLGFERVERCRNCGYDFSLTAPADPLELPLKPPRGEPEGRPPLHDLSFLDRAMATAPEEAGGDLVPEDRHREPDRPGARQPTPSGPSPTPTEELPLFGSPIPDDLPLITKPSAPRQPLAVRRATPEVPRLRSGPPKASSLDLGFEPPEPEPAPGEVAAIEASTARHAGATEDATIGSRLAAVLVDLLILAAIDAAVVYFTMQICGVGLDDLAILPRAPLFAFLLVQNGGYLVVFTAGGQTLGKMAAGIKVVSAESLASLDLGRAFVRELAWLLLAAPAGLGLLTTLNRDRRGFHDRFAGTRVIRASL